MTQDALNTAAPDTLARLLEAESAPGVGARDVAAVMAHQLAASLLPDLLDFPGAEPQRTETLIHITPGLKTFADLLEHRQPPLELLDALRLFARHHRDNASSPIHGDPATLLYFAAIAAGLVHGGARLTQLNDEQLREGLMWGIAHPAAGLLVELLRAATSAIGTE